MVAAGLRGPITRQAAALRGVSPRTGGLGPGPGPQASASASDTPALFVPRRLIATTDDP